MDEYHTYSYCGPVVHFGKCVASKWKGETVDLSERKARSNLTYQVKKQMNLIAGTNISLPGSIKMVD